MFRNNKICKGNKDKINSLLFTLFLFSDMLTFPLMMLTGSSVFFWIFMLLTLIVSTLLNKSINKTVLIVFICGTVIFMINVLLVDYKLDVLYIYMLFIRVGIFSLHFSSLINDYKILIKYYYVLSIVSLLISNIYLNYYEITNRYMDLGIHLSQIFIGLAIYNYNVEFKYKIINYFLLLLVIIEILIFGNRSSLIICMVVLFYFELVNIKLNKKGVFIFLLKVNTAVISIFFLIFNINYLIELLINFTMKLGIYSYSITKLKLTVQSGLFGIAEQSSGRDVLYPLIKDIIIESNFLPKGVGYLPFITNYHYVYPHNLFLEIALDFGIIGLMGFILMVIFLWKKYFYISSKDKIFRDIVTAMVIFSFIRLMFSGSYWQEPLFWGSIGLILFYSVNKFKETLFISRK